MGRGQTDRTASSAEHGGWLLELSSTTPLPGDTVLTVSGVRHERSLWPGELADGLRRVLRDKLALLVLVPMLFQRSEQGRTAFWKSSQSWLVLAWPEQAPRPS